MQDDARNVAAQPCANCRAVVSGQYCAACGQRVERHVHSLGFFIREAFESITHADSRLWRTLTSLLLRPGELTREFFAGRRVHYLPPVRLYLVVSVAFFLVAALGGDWVLVLGDGGDGGEQRAALTTVAARLEEELGATTDTTRRAELANLLTALRERSSGAAGTGATGAATPAQPACAPESFEFFDMPAAEARLAAACEAIVADGGRSLGAAFADNLPLALFVLLPLLAAVMKLLYLPARRYYVEHLLLLVHNHAAAFLALLAATVLAWLAPSARGWLWAAVVSYLLWYGYRSLRVAYAESRGVTLAKCAALGVAYTLFGSLLLLVTVAWSALTL